MKDCSQESLESGRPQAMPLETIRFCLNQLFADKSKSIYGNVCAGLTYEELIGALLQARDLAEAAEKGESV